MAILPTVSKENEENAEENTSQLPKRRSSKKALRTNYRVRHANSPSKNVDCRDSTSSLRGEQNTEKDDDRRIQWEDDGSPASLIRDLDETLAEQGWCTQGNGVYIHDEVEHIDGTPHHAKSYFDSFPSNQRTGLQRRLNVEIPKEGSSSIDNIDEVAALSPDTDKNACRRIIQSHAIRPNYSITAKRRMVVMFMAVGLAALGYFIEVKQIMNTQGGSGAPSDWIMSLPRSFPASILGSGENHRDMQNVRMEEALFAPTENIISMEAEWKRVKHLSKKRAESRRLRTKPPTAYPTTPGTAAANGAVLMEREVNLDSTLPRLTLDLPAHRQLDNALVDHRSLRAIDNDVGHRQLLRTGGSQPGQTSPCGEHAREASQLDPNHFPSSANIGPKSRVVVTGAMTQVGMELILQLHEHCRVGFIVGIDAAYPNTRHERIGMIESRYKYLSRRVPGFQRLVVPVFGIHPHPKMGEEVPFESAGNGFDLVSRLKPTHVVHLAGMEEGRSEYTDYGDTVDASPFAETGKRSMMRRFDSLLSMDQVLSSLAKFNAAQEAGGQQQPQLVYVSSNEAGDQPGVTMQNTASIPRPASVYGTSSLLKEVLASFYHRHHGVDSVGLRIPTVFGPFLRDGSLMHDLAERTVRNAVGKDVEGISKYHLDRGRYELPHMGSKREGATSGASEQMVYVYDVASAILSAMQFKDSDNGATLMRLGSKMASSINDLKERMEGYLPPVDQQESNSLVVEARGSNAVLNSPGLSIYDTERNRNLLGWSEKTHLHEGTKSMLAWQILQNYPFGLPESVPSHSTFLNIIEDSRPTLSYFSLPCASGCRWGGTMCSKSPWDEVIETTIEITRTCPYVLYTLDLRPELTNLEKQSAPSQREGWEDYFCKIAFVSSSSKLAGTVYGNELKQKTPMHEWNGKAKLGHWIIVTLRGTQYSMPEFQRSLAKFTPTKLFSKRVIKAMYINHRRVSLSTDQAMGVMRHMDLNERKSPKKHTIVNKKTGNVDIWLPPQPERHSVFFTNKYSFGDGSDADRSSAKKLARFVMTNNGIAETKDIRAQMQFYEETGHLTRTNMQRSPNYQEFFQDNFFPYDFLRSSWLVHELKSEEGRNLRCEMYEEHSLWGNADMDDLSMGYVLAKRKVQARLGKVAEPQYEGPEEWYPLLVPAEPGDDNAITEGSVYLDYLESAQKVTTDHKGHEYYVTFLPQKQKQ